MDETEDCFGCDMRYKSNHFEKFTVHYIKRAMIYGTKFWLCNYKICNTIWDKKVSLMSEK